MVLVRISGGLGNQMFQYAAGYSLAKASKDKLELDTTFYNMGNSRHLQLYEFNVVCKEKEEFIKPGCNKLLYLLGIIIKKVFLIRKNFFVISEQNIAKTADNKYVYGYFQSSKYFSSCRDDIKKQFCLKSISKAYDQWSRIIGEKRSCSVHIRRTDYLMVGAEIDNNYYKKAIAMINPDDRLFFFSDDIAWTKEFVNNNLEFKGFEVFYVSEDKSLISSEELMLMSICKDHIIANSTFSWWGAYLSEKDASSQIIAPKLGMWDENFYEQGWELIEADRIIETTKSTTTKRKSFKSSIVDSIKKWGLI